MRRQGETWGHPGNCVTIGPAVPQFKIKFGGRTLSLPTGSHLVGRMSDCFFTLDDDLTSRYHARLHVTASDLTVEDLDSSNGTFLNGLPS